MCSGRSSRNCLWLSATLVAAGGCAFLFFFSYRYWDQTTKICERCDKVAKSERLTHAGCPEICLTKDCVSFASFLMDNMDESINPCEDFFTFSCGGWKKKFSQSDNGSIIEEMTKRLRFALRDTLENIKELPESNSGKLKILYDSCADERTSENNAVSVAMELLGEFGLQGWSNWNTNNEIGHFDLERTIAILNAHKEFAFITIRPNYNIPPNLNSTDGSNKELKIQVDYPLLYNNASTEEHREPILRILSYLGLSSDVSDSVWNEFKKLDNFVLELFSESSTRDQEREEERVINLQCTSTVSSDLEPLCRVLKKFVEIHQLKNEYSDEEASITDTFYVENIFKHLSNFTNRSINSYLSLRFIIRHVNEMNSLIRTAGKEFPQLPQTGLQRKDETFLNSRDRCTAWIMKQLAFPLAKEYVSQTFKKHHLKEIQTLMKSYQNEASRYVETIKYMTRSEKQRLRLRIENIRMGTETYLNALFNNTLLDSFLEKFHPARDSFLRNVVKLQRNILQFAMVNYEELGKVQVRDEPFEVNAFHTEGEIELGLGLLQIPWYQPERPKLLNSVALGSGIGHEIGHEINLFFENDEELGSTSLGTYQEIKRCLENQYFSYEIQKLGKKVLGNQTVGENLADLIEREITQQIIDKYFEEEEGEYSNFQLPGLKYSTAQLLYISLAQMWCSTRSKEEEEFHYDKNPHAPSDIRVIGIAQNSKGFSKAFHCPSGSHMNPVHKCAFNVEGRSVEDSEQLVNATENEI